QIGGLKYAGVLVNDHRRPITMTEMHDLDFHSLLTQCHGHGRKNERRWHFIGFAEEHLLQLRKTAESHGLKKTVALQILVDEIRHRTREMTRHRDESNTEL